MEVQKYKHHEDSHAAENLLASRGLPLNLALDLPVNGFIARYRGEPVAMGFIRLIEGGYGQIDSLITNSQFPSDIRDTVVDLLVSNLIKSSKSMGLRKLISYTLDSNTLARSYRHGFERSSHSVITLDLSKEA